MGAVEVNGLAYAYAYGDRRAVCDLDSEVAAGEVLAARSLVGFLVAFAVCLVGHGHEIGHRARPVALVVGLGVSILVCSEPGLLYGLIARDGKTVCSLAQMLNMVILAPLFWYFFPSWPQWPARLFPTWWFIDPLYRVTLQGASLAQVGPDLCTGLGFAVLLAVPVFLLGRRLRRRGI